MSTQQNHHVAAEEWLRRAEQAWENEDGDPMLTSVIAQSAATIAHAYATLARPVTIGPSFREIATAKEEAWGAAIEYSSVTEMEADEHKAENPYRRPADRDTAKVAR